MLKYLSKITMDILPSVAATIIGAYIVNHYITAKPATNVPVAPVVSTAVPKKVDAASADLGNIPTAGVRAKGISEKAIFEKSAAEKPPEKPADKPVVAEKSAEKEKAAEKERSAEKEKSPEKSAEKSLEQPEAETASISADIRRHTPAPREKTAIRVIPLTAAAQPAVQPAASVPTVEATVNPEERRDANDLARAAIERLRGGNESPRAPETVRIPEAAPRVASVPQASGPQAPTLRPLPPPIVVSTPPADSSGSGPPPTQAYPAAAQINDPRRPTPPADIPPAAPVDLHAEPVDAPARPHTNVAEDMLLAAKSVFHSVLPQ
jgi:hypothetical protein